MSVFIKLFFDPLFLQISAIDEIFDTVVCPGCCFQPAMIPLITDEFIHAIDFFRDIIEMRRNLYENLAALMFSSDLDVLLMLESFDSLLSNFCF